MKKRMLGILLVLAVLVAVCALSVSAVDEDFFTGTGYCEACGATVSWQPLTQEVVTAWNGDYSTANGTHYYVSESTVTTPSALTVNSGETLHLHLNGNVFKRSGVRVINVNGELAVMDHSAGKGILQAGANNTSTGGVVRVNKSGAKFDLYGGTVKMVSGTNPEAKDGGCVYMVSGTQFNMHGGTITGGKAAGSGGSLYISSGATATLHAGTITGGVTAANGGNIYNAGNLILGGCTISDGTAETGNDLYFADTATLQIKSGFAGSARAAFAESLLPETLSGGTLAETFAACEGVFSGKIYLENQTREAYLFGKDGDTKVYIFVDLPENTPLPTTCAHCKQTVTWLPLTKAVADAWAGNYDPSAGTHYYVAEDTVTLSKTVTIAEGEELCLHLNGRDFFRSGTRALAVNGTVNLIDHASNRGTVSAYGDYSSTGCVIRVYEGGNVNMYGGTVKMLPGSSTNKTFAGNGGCVYMAEGAGTFTMYGGIITDGKASAGGNLYVAKNATFKLEGGTIQNGQTVSNTPYTSLSVKNMHGGNVYLGAGATMIVSGGTITNGVSVESGGNIMCSGSFTISGGTISDGQAKLAGNLYISSGATGNINGGTITGGTASDRGGNLYMSSTSSKLNMTAGLISNGKSTNKGGNLFANNGVANLTGGTITGGNGSGGGNISVNAGANSDTNYVKLAGTKVSDGTATSYGKNLYVSGTLIFGGSSTVENGNVYMDSKSKLQVESNFTGEATLFFTNAHVATPIQGNALTDTLDSCAGPFTGKLYVENMPQLPYLYGKTGDAKLYVTGAARVADDSTYTWYTDNEAMMAAVNGTEAYILAAPGQLTLAGGTYLVDLSGQTVNVTGSGSVTFFDSANADCKTYGTATVSGVTVKNGTKTTVNGDLYYTLREGDSYSFHMLQVALTNVNIRPASTGIYYDGLWGCDEKLATELVDSFGVAVSLGGMPNENFEDNSSVLATVYTPDQLEAGASKTGVIIQGILNAEDTAYRNDVNGRRPIYARAYLKLKDGTVIMSDAGAAESLYSATTRLDQLIDENPYIYRHYQRIGQDFVETWLEDGMGGWELKNLLPSARLQESAEEAEVLKVLILGSSRSVNTFYRLYDVFKDQMPDKEFVFGIMYYSGCSMTMHKDFISRDACVYRYYRNTNGTWNIQEPVTMEYGLKDQKWDIIFLQAGTGDLANQMNLECRLYITDYVDKMIPDHPHEFWFHTTWFNSTDPALYVNANTTIDPATVDQYKTLTQGVDTAKAYVFNDPMFEGQICSGTPLMYALKVLEVPEIELYRDHTHLSDYGCLLVGYAFYTQLTGNPVTEINLETIPAANRQPQYQSKGDLTVTEEMKDMILQTAAYNYENPWTIPVKE